MPPRRKKGGPEPDVVLSLDGAEIPAVAGEPVALALLAAGRRVLSRSVKYHRPRGAHCFSGRCDGCLLRVDGRPSVATCRLPARHGMTLETQNVVGSAEHDLLAATDFLFPAGVNHHEMFTWSKPANRTMQLVAREIAGVGTLPDAPEPPRPVARRAVDVLVVGAGVAGLTCAAGCAARGLDVLVVDEERAPGGTLLWWPGEVEHDGARVPATAVARTLGAAAEHAGAELVAGASALGVFEETSGARVVLVTTAAGTLVVTPRRLVIAQGRAETGWAFAGNDLPGVYGLDAALRAFAGGVLVGMRPALVGEGEGLVALRAALEAAGARPLGPFPREALRRARGRTGVSSVELEGGIAAQACDALVVAAPEGALFELAAQAGAETFFSGAAFELRASDLDGATQERFVRVVGGAAGARPLEASIAQSGAAARALAAELDAPTAALAAPGAPTR